MRALHIAATGMSAQQTRVEVVSNNLANMSTPGYNARRAEFADLHYQQMTRPGTVNAADGVWFFDNDTNGRGNPILNLTGQAAIEGRIDVWVGSASEDTCTATLEVESWLD